MAIILIGLARSPNETSGASQKPCDPSITNVSPASAFVGELITLQGACLNDVLEDSLSVGDVQLSIVSKSDTALQARVVAFSPVREVSVSAADTTVKTSFEIRNWVEPLPEDIVPGRLMVELADGADPARVFSAVGFSNAQQILPSSGFPELDRWWSMEIAGDEIAAARELAADEDVIWAQPATERDMRVATPPNDPCYATPTAQNCDEAPFYAGLTGLPPMGDDGQWGVQMIAAEGAWEITTGDPSVRVAVMDTGLDPHEDIDGADYFDYTGDAYGTQDDLDHGTRVAGIIGASLDNGLGIAGVAPSTSIASMRTHTPSGGAANHVEPCGGAGEPLCVRAWVAAVLEAAPLRDISIVNMSFGGLQPYNGLEQGVINTAHTQGVVMVAAAGNENWNLDDPINVPPGYGLYPAAYNHAISVGGTAKDDQRAVWASFGSNYGSIVDISAPAWDIMSTAASRWVAPYSSWFGTSFAAPMVAGVAALLASEGFYGCEIVETLTGTDQLGSPISADTIASPGMGVGRLNAQKALEWWSGGPIVSDTVWPAGAIIHKEGDPARYILTRGGKQPLSGSFDERDDQCIPGSLLDSIPLDTDGDHFSDADEIVIGTDPLEACPLIVGVHDAWPVDFDMNRVINTTDYFQLAPPVFGSSVGDPYYTVRADIVPDGVINTTDVFQVLPPVLGSSCVP